jgi:predicted ArsR family transcriptional regulator
MGDPSTRDRWEEDRTTFQRIYDVVLGTQEYQSATAFADHASCSETAARRALEQLAEMGIADRREGRPATYRRNEAYLTWKRVESLAREHTPETLRSRLDELVADDQDFQQRLGVPDPDAVTVADLPVDDHETAEQRWEALSEWRTVRRDIRVLRRAVQRAEARVDDGTPA